MKSFEVITALGRMEPDTVVYLRWPTGDIRLDIDRIDLIFEDGEWSIEITPSLGVNV